MPNIHAVFFDIGDTLVYDNPPLFQRFARALTQSGLDFNPADLPAAWRKAENVGVSLYVRGLSADNPTVQRLAADAALTHLGLPPLREAQWETLAAHFARIPFARYAHPGAAAVLAGLHARGLQIGVISDWDTRLPDVLGSLGLLHFFDSLSISASVGATQPDPRLFRHGLETLRVAPENALHVGDWQPLDIDGARAAGMSALLLDIARRTPVTDAPRVVTFAALAAFLAQIG